MLRGIAVTAVLATSLAIVVARIAPHPLQTRRVVRSPYMAINGPFFTPEGSDTQVLDMDTGTLSTLAVADGEMIQWASFSDWTDERGERQGVGRWFQSAHDFGGQASSGVGLCRFAFPSGRELNRITLEAVPSGPSCWYPGTAARILFASADGQLYHYAFESPDGTIRASSAQRVQAVTWPRLPRPFVRTVVLDPCWPKDPRLGGRLFASITGVSERAGQNTFVPSRIWWLQLTPDGTAIESAAPLSTVDLHPAILDGPPLDERFPSVGRTRDGGLVIAYQVRPQADKGGRLEVARLDFDRATGVPTISQPWGRELAANCGAIAAGFSPVGDGLYVLHVGETGQSFLQRISLAAILSPPLPALSSLKHAAARPRHGFTSAWNEPVRSTQLP